MLKISVIDFPYIDHVLILFSRGNAEMREMRDASPNKILFRI